MLIVVIPAVAAALALYWWLSTGRYVSTDNAFVGADKTMVTPYVTGPIVAIHVKEGQAVKVGDPLFDIDPAPFETALALAQGRLAAAKVEFANLKSQYASNIDQIKMGEDSVRLHQADFDRKHKLVATPLGNARPTQDTSAMALVQAQQILEFVAQHAGYGEGQARRRTRRVDRDVSRLHAGQGRGRRRRAQPGLHPRQGAPSPASPRRCRRSSSAASRRRGSRCSPSSPTRAFGSTPIPRNPT